MQLFSVVVTDTAIGELGPASAISRWEPCQACHRSRAPVVNQVDYRLTSWNPWDSGEWFVIEGVAHVVSNRVQQRLQVEPQLHWQSARVVTAEGLGLFPFFQLVAAPQVPPAPGLVYEWFCDDCAETSLSLTSHGQRCAETRRLEVSRASWGELAVGAHACWPHLLVRDDVADALSTIKLKDVRYEPVAWI